MDIKEEVKEEPCIFLDFSSQNDKEFFMKDLVTDRLETVTSSSDIKQELDDSTCSQNEEHIMRFNKTNKESDIKTEIYFKEEHWLERENSCINDDIRDETHEHLYSTKPPSYASDLFSIEDSGNDISIKINKDSPQCESDRKYERQESLAFDISSVEASVCEEKSNNGKIVSTVSSSKQSKLLHQSNRDKLDINNEGCKSVLSHECKTLYEYEVPGKCLKYPSHLEKHKLVLGSNEVNKHDVRDKVLNQLSSLKSQELADDIKRTHKCNICNKTFTVLTSLKNHKLIHEGIKPHKCCICNKAFTRLSDLKRHKLIHEGIKPHKCNICNKTFTHLSHLKQHKFIHEDIKPHKCNTCNKNFMQISHLKRHKLIHEGIKPHKCNICDKAFRVLASLKNHKLIHEGIKPHKCDICNKGFTQLSDLKEHKLIHEGIKPHKCKICNKGFMRLSHLKRHILIHQDK